MERENLGLIFRKKLNKDSFSFLTINHQSVNLDHTNNI